MLISAFVSAQEFSVARSWNEALLEAIRNDYARPTVHARNLFHVSAAMYDAWAISSGSSNTYLIGNSIKGFTSSFESFNPGTQDEENLLNKSISYAAYRLLYHRFVNSPRWEETQLYLDSVFNALGMDPSFTSVDYSTGSAAALGNYIAREYIDYGLQDGSNEQNRYVNTYYTPINEYLSPENPGNPNITHPNRWQPLGFNTFIDQSGNEIPGAVPDFLSPEWGNVNPFSLPFSLSNVYSVGENTYRVFHDPGPPPMIDLENGSDTLYQWGFSMVAVWSGHLDPDLNVTLDISPNNLGNLDISSIPTDFSEYDNFYDYKGGGDPSTGRSLNPHTGEPYPSQVVKLGDYARVLAEFWADGPDSETPPGHWFTILNYVSDHPQLEKKFEGTGDLLSDLEWDIKSYFILGGAMHDVAISSWSINGYYDYVRPISAIRYMGDQGQSSDPDLPNYSPNGLPLVPGFIEIVGAEDPLVGGENQEHLNKIKLKAWRGPDYIEDPATDYAGVDWILAENWWPYQRPTFVTPPFAGYISGHSTYSRAAAEVLTLLTGSEYFPGGVGEFVAPQNEFLVFEDGPSEDVILQWATYRDASDQCSLSRIWGGIHPSFDDIPGRFIGAKIGVRAFDYAKAVFDGLITSAPDISDHKIYPNPFNDQLSFKGFDQFKSIEIIDPKGVRILSYQYPDLPNTKDLRKLKEGMYFIRINEKSGSETFRIIKSVSR